ncbi:MAG: ribonuclease III [Clostridiales bacterium]|nr:ribonuclease III [Clostridiales bacterium]
MISEIEKVINYQFRDQQLLINALTHSSYSNEELDKTSSKNNERLEFLGDAIFDAIISEYLYKLMTDVEEGRLSKLRAMIVCESSLAECGKRLGINKYLRLGRGEENNGGRERNSIIADAMEAIIGAIFLDGGIEKAREFVLNFFKPTIELALSGKLNTDFKSEIQERLQAQGVSEITYKLDKQKGPDHNKTFYVSLWADGNMLGTGEGKTKKEAEQNAAKAALEV